MPRKPEHLTSPCDDDSTPTRTTLGQIGLCREGVSCAVVVGMYVLLNFSRRIERRPHAKESFKPMSKPGHPHNSKHKMIHSKKIARAWLFPGPRQGDQLELIASTILLRGEPPKGLEPSYRQFTKLLHYHFATVAWEVSELTTKCSDFQAIFGYALTSLDIIINQ